MKISKTKLRATYEKLYTEVCENMLFVNSLHELKKNPSKIDEILNDYENIIYNKKIDIATAKKQLQLATLF